MASPTQWTWVWAHGSWWWTGKPGMLRSMKSQRVGLSEDLNGTEQQKDAVFLWNPLYWTITALWAFVGFGDDLLWLSWFANISLHSRVPSFLKVSFFGHLLWNWSRSHFPGFGLFLIALGDGFQKTLQGNHPNPKRPLSLYPRMFYVFLKTLIGSLLTFRYLWFGVNLMNGVRECSTSFSFSSF